MEVILEQKLDESNVFCYFYSFDPFWGPKWVILGKKGAKSAHLPLDQQVYTNKIKVKTEIVRISVFSW